MRYKLLNAALICVMPIFTYMACDKSTQHDSGNGNTKTCPDNVICTQMYAMVNVQVKDASNNPVKLDETYTVRNSTGERIAPEAEVQIGYYTILSDSYVKKLQNSQDNFTFIGMKDGKKVVNETYVISADCCHIRKVTGKDSITIP